MDILKFLGIRRGIPTREVACPWCNGKKKIIEGQTGITMDGFPYSTHRKVICNWCGGRGKGDFDFTSEQVIAHLDAMRIISES